MHQNAGEASSKRSMSWRWILGLCNVWVNRRHANPAAGPRSALWRVPAWQWQCGAVNQSWKAVGRWLKAASPPSGCPSASSITIQVPAFVGSFWWRPISPPIKHRGISQMFREACDSLPKTDFLALFWSSFFFISDFAAKLKYFWTSAQHSFIRISYIYMDFKNIFFLLLFQRWLVFKHHVAV